MFAHEAKTAIVDCHVGGETAGLFGKGQRERASMCKKTLSAAWQNTGEARAESYCSYRTDCVLQDYGL